MNKIHAFTAILLLFISISGCADMPILSGWLGGTEVEQYTHDVIIIKDIKVTPTPTLRPGQMATLSIVVKNVQEIGFDYKRDVKVILYDTCGIFSIETAGRLCSGEWDNPETCRFTELYPQTEQEVIWKLRANDIKVEQSCDVGIQVKYSHVTDTSSSVDFANQKEIERLVSQGKGTSSIGKMTLGEGPVKLYIQVPDQPILVGDSIETSTGILEFWAENKGSGIVDGGKVKRIQLGNSVSGRAKFKKTMDDENVLTFIDSQDPKNAITTTLTNKKTPTHTWIIMPGAEQMGKIQDRIYLVGNVSYDYKFIKNIQLTVQPLR